MFSLEIGDVAFRLKFLTNRNFGHFCTKFTQIFFPFERIFNFLLEPQNMLYAGFGAKTRKLHYGRNSWPFGTSGTFWQNLTNLFFFRKNFPFFSWTTKYTISKFRSKNANIVFRPELWTNRSKGPILTNFALFLFNFFMEFSTCFLDYWIYYLHIFKQKWGHLLSGRHSYPVGTWVIFVQNLSDFFFLSKEFSNFFLGPLNILFASFSWKMPTLYSGKNSWAVGQKGFFEQILPEFFFITYFILFLFLFYCYTFSTCFWVLWIYYLQVFIEKWRRCIPVEIPDSWNLGHFRTKFTRIFFLFQKNFPLCFRTTKFSICRFWSKNGEIAFWSKFMTSRS